MQAILFSFLAIAIVTVSARTSFRLWHFRVIELDDILLIVSALFMVAGIVLAYEARDLAYLQMSVSLGLVEPPPPDFFQRMATYQLLLDLGAFMTWGSIFIVKLSFLVFFKRLVNRVRFVDKFWWVAFLFTLAGLAVNLGMNFYICADFGSDSVAVCTVSGQTHREGIYLIVTSVADIFTDLLVIAVPILLLWRAKIDLRRKLALGTVCCLSAVMIILSLVRVLLAPVKSPDPALAPITDTLWLFIFQAVEAAVAIVMVSITAFRSMLGQKGHSSNRSRDASHEGTVTDGWQKYRASDVIRMSTSKATPPNHKWQQASWADSAPRPSPKEAISRPMPVQTSATSFASIHSGQNVSCEM